MSEPVRRGHSVYRFVGDAETHVQVNLSYDVMPDGDFVRASVRIVIFTEKEPHPIVEFALSRMPNDLVHARASALGASPGATMLAEMGLDDRRNIRLGEVESKPVVHEAGDETAKISASVAAYAATIRISVGDWSDTLEVSIENPDDGDQLWAVTPKSGGWTFNIA